MLLNTLIRKALPDFTSAEDLPHVEILSLECDSRLVKPGSIFVAVQGARQDGKIFITDAIGKGAVAVVSDGQEGPVGCLVPFIQVHDGRGALAKIAAVFYGKPSLSMKIIGITGTNGKTTCSYLVEHFLINEEKFTGVIGTVNYRFKGKEIPAVETTPGPIKIQSMLSDMLSAQCDYAVMEVSSHALEQKRVAEIDFVAALFTNLTQDHLDYHKTLEAYFESKSKLFSGLSETATAILNIEDEYGKKIIGRTRAKVLSYGLLPTADLRAENIQLSPMGAEYTVVYRGVKTFFQSPLIGLHNVYNVLGSLGVMATLGFSLEKAAASLRVFAGVPGRLEAVEAGQAFGVYIDFAHTPDGLLNVLKALQDCRKGRLIAVFGCGGERDRTKRPLMGTIAQQYCDQVIVTSDNPRSENPKTIAEEICSGFGKDYKGFSVVIDRKKAIRQALLSAREGDLVLIAGKGHECTQVIAGTSYPFSDREEVERVLSGR